MKDGKATNVLWHIARGETREAAYAAARSLFLGVFHEAVLTGGRTTVEKWAKADPRAIGWRRVSDGDPCAFCAMLVTRGPVYTSRRKALTTANPAKGIPAGALHKYHPHCGCTVEVVYGDWQPTEQEQSWIDEYYRAAESLPKGTPRTQDTVLPLMRRNGSFRDSKTRRSTPEALAERRRPYAERKARAEIMTTIPPVPPREDAAQITSDNSPEWPSWLQYPPQERIDHILHGEPKKGLGGHLYGTGTLKKTEFPKNWNAERIIDSIRQVMMKPEWVRPALDPRAMYRFGRVVDGVQVEVGAFLADGWQYRIDRAYPRGGRGVTRNMKNGRIAQPPVRNDDWKDRK